MDIALIIIVGLALYRIKCMWGGYNTNYLNKESTTAINGLFVCFVFLRHFSQYIEYGKFDYAFSKIDSRLGQLIVVSFLFYSGYGIMTSIKNKGNIYIKEILRKRLLKIYCHFIIIIPLFLLVGYAVGNTYDLFTILQAILAWKTVGNSTWYIFCILILYLFTYFSFRIMNRWDKNKYQYAVAGVILLCLIYIVVLHNIKPSHWYNTIIAYPLGMAYSIYRKQIETIVQKNNTLYALILAGTLLCSLVTFHYQAHFICYEILVSCFIAMICLVSMKISVKNKILLWLGKYTFEIYILQRLPMALFQALVPNKYLYFMICIVVTFIIAMLYRKLTDQLDKYIVG